MKRFNFKRKLKSCRDITDIRQLRTSIFGNMIECYTFINKDNKIDAVATIKANFRALQPLGDNPNKFTKKRVERLGVNWQMCRLLVAEISFLNKNSEK